MFILKKPKKRNEHPKTTKQLSLSSKETHLNQKLWFSNSLSWLSVICCECASPGIRLVALKYCLRHSPSTPSL